MSCKDSCSTVSSCLELHGVDWLCPCWDFCVPLNNITLAKEINPFIWITGVFSCGLDSEQRQDCPVLPALYHALPHCTD